MRRGSLFHLKQPPHNAMSAPHSPRPSEDVPPQKLLGPDTDSLARLHPDVRAWIRQQINITVDALATGGIAIEASHVEKALANGRRRLPPPEDCFFWRSLVLGLAPPASRPPSAREGPTDAHRDKRQRTRQTPPPVQLTPHPHHTTERPSRPEPPTAQGHDVVPTGRPQSVAAAGPSDQRAATSSSPA